jgi:uncharacterized protein YndB with AHSA1/START domain
MAQEEIRWRIHLAAAPATVFELLATAEGRRSFWAEEAPERDGVVEFRFADGSRLAAPVVERLPGRRFALRYFGGSTAVFDLAPDGRGGTDLTLTEHEVAAESWRENYPGWLSVLFALKGAAAFRVDLRNHDPARSWAWGYVDG